MVDSNAVPLVSIGTIQEVAIDGGGLLVAIKSPYFSHCCDIFYDGVLVGEALFAPSGLHAREYDKLQMAFLEKGTAEERVQSSFALWKDYSMSLDIGYRPEYVFFNYSTELLCSLEYRATLGKATIGRFVYTDLEEGLQEIMGMDFSADYRIHVFFASLVVECLRQEAIFNLIPDRDRSPYREGAERISVIVDSYSIDKPTEELFKEYLLNTYVSKFGDVPAWTTYSFEDDF